MTSMPCRIRSTIRLLLLVLCLNAVASERPQFVGSAACVSCHEDIVAKWTRSDHWWAMQPATDDTVLADFDDQQLIIGDVTSRMFRGESGTGFYVETENATGESETFRVEYTFGHDSLQQYLVNIGGGRLQALTLAWDTRPLQAGGQRWFSLDPEPGAAPGDALHWTGPFYNWNSRCAECHTTDFRKGFEFDTDTYQSTWAEGTVGCEACHGAAAGHLEWASTRASGEPDRGFAGNFEAPVVLPRLDGQQTRLPAASRVPGNQISRCGGCHARRSLLVEAHASADDFHDRYRLSPVEAPAYYPDGQIRDEVFVLGSFLQSRMHDRGVTCTHCHDPHTARLRFDGDQTCTQCHAAPVFAATSHHHHSEKSEGARCVSCHMPETTYMRVDPRRDHSFRIPRPELEARAGAPNACVRCHADRSSTWAAGVLRDWRGEKPRPRHYLDSFVAIALGGSGIEEDFSRLLAADETPGIIKAATLRQLADTPLPGRLPLIDLNRQHNSPLVRAAVAAGYRSVALNHGLEPLRALLADPAKVVRLAAFETLLAPGHRERVASYEAADRELVEHVEQEYLAALLQGVDTGSGLTNLANYRAANGHQLEAIRLFERAIALEPWSSAPRINLADLYRRKGEDEKALALLVAASDALPERAEIRHALGLAYVRSRQYDKALQALRQATELAPEADRFRYVYAVALHSTGDVPGALAQMETVSAHTPVGSEEARFGLELALQMQRLEFALAMARTLRSWYPDDPYLADLLARLEARVGEIN